MWAFDGWSFTLGVSAAIMWMMAVIFIIDRIAEGRLHPCGEDVCKGCARPSCPVLFPTGF